MREYIRVDGDGIQVLEAFVKRLRVTVDHLPEK